MLSQCKLYIGHTSEHDNFTWLCAGLHVFWPVSLLAGIVTVTCIPAAVEDGFFPAVGAPLFLFGLVHCLLLFRLCLLFHFSHQALSLLFQTLPHLCHCQFCKRDKTKLTWNWYHVWKEETKKNKHLCLLNILKETGSVQHQLSGGVRKHSWKQETYQDCASSLTTLVDAATGAFQSLFLTVESVAKTQRVWNFASIMTN